MSKNALGEKGKILFFYIIVYKVHIAKIFIKTKTIMMASEP
jgi:hypothetical protein